MSLARGCLVIELTDDWKIITADQTRTFGKQDLSADELAGHCADMVRSSGESSPLVVLAPASTSCFFCVLELDDSGVVADSQLLKYELENLLPIDAESTVASFQPIPDEPNKVVAVAIESGSWKRLADSFEQADLQVQSIVPAAVLAAHSACQWVDRNNKAQLLLCGDGQIDAMTLSNHQVVAWKHLPDQPKSLARHLSMMGQHDQVVAIGFQQDAIDRLPLDPATLHVGPPGIDPLIVGAAQQRFDGGNNTWFELRRDDLAAGDPLRAIGSQLRWLLVAAAACLLVFAVGGWYRTQRIEAEIADVRQQQEDRFRKAFPDQRSRAILRRVRSEHAKALGSMGQDDDVPIPTSAPHVVRAFLLALPKNVRFQVKRVEITNGELKATIRVANAIDIGKIATAVKNAGFDVAAPGTRQIDPQTIESVLEATWIDPSAKETTG